MGNSSPIFETRPLYLQVHSRLIGFITRAEWKPGDLIPNEIELARVFGVSVGTMRKALQTLTEQGLLTRRQGRGTFVAEIETRDAVPLDNLRTVRHEPMEWRVLRSEFSAGPGTDEEIEALELGEGANVFRLRRALQDEVTTSVLLENCTLPQARFAGLDSNKGAHTLPISQLARRYGLLIAPGTEKIDLHNATADDAKLMNVKLGTAVMKLTRTARCFDRIPVEFRVALCDLKTGAAYTNKIR